MKRIIVLLIVAGFGSWAVMSCGGGEKKAADSETTEGADEYGDYETAQPEEASTDDLIKQGQVLTDASDCKTCHHATNKIVGPSHTDVARKYEFNQANITYLAGKIKQGGSGVWGEIPMTAHPDISQSDAEKMAMYVLSLDGEKPQE